MFSFDRPVKMKKADDQLGIGGFNRNNNRIAAEYIVDPFDKILNDISKHWK